MLIFMAITILISLNLAGLMIWLVLPVLSNTATLQGKSGSPEPIGFTSPQLNQAAHSEKSNTGPQSPGMDSGVGDSLVCTATNTVVKVSGPTGQISTKNGTHSKTGPELNAENVNRTVRDSESDSTSQPDDTETGNKRNPLAI